MDNTIAQNTKMEQHYAQRIQASPSSREIAQYLNENNAIRKAAGITRLAEDSHKNKVRVKKLNQLLQDLNYPKAVQPTDLSPIIGYFLFHSHPHNIDCIPVS